MGTMLWARRSSSSRRIRPPISCRPGNPRNLAFYDISPLKRCSSAWSISTASMPGDPLQRRATNIKTGNLTYFDNMTHKVGPAHVMASGSLPPGFSRHRGRRRVLLDGGITLQHARCMGARRPAARGHAGLPGRSVDARAASYRATLSRSTNPPERHRFRAHPRRHDAFRNCRRCAAPRPSFFEQMAPELRQTPRPSLLRRRPT